MSEATCGVSPGFASLIRATLAGFLLEPVPAQAGTGMDVMV